MDASNNTQDHTVQAVCASRGSASGHDTTPFFAREAARADCERIASALGLEPLDPRAWSDAMACIVADVGERLSGPLLSHELGVEEWEYLLVRREFFRYAVSTLWIHEVNDALAAARPEHRDLVVAHVRREVLELPSCAHGRLRQLMDPGCWVLSPCHVEGVDLRYLHLHRLTALIVLQDEARAHANKSLEEAAREAITARDTQPA
jgi:hypothetical protein